MEQVQNNPFSEIRQSLAEARAALQKAEDAFNSAKTRAEMRLVYQVGSLKAVATNPSDSNRAFAFAVEQDEACAQAQDALREAAFQVALLEGALEGLRDQQRERTIRVWERYLDSDSTNGRFSLPHLRETAA